MSGVPTRAKNKKNPGTQGKEKNRSINESELTPEEASMASFQSSLDGISKQIQALQNEMKTDLKTFKDEITAQMRNELTQLKGNIDQKFAKITTDIGEHEEKICAALTRTEEPESRSYEANGALQDIMQEQKMIMDKLDNLESRSRWNNLRVYGIQLVSQSRSSWINGSEPWLQSQKRAILPDRSSLISISLR